MKVYRDTFQKRDFTCPILTYLSVSVPTPFKCPFGAIYKVNNYFINYSSLWSKMDGHRGNGLFVLFSLLCKYTGLKV